MANSGAAQLLEQDLLKDEQAAEPATTPQHNRTGDCGRMSLGGAVKTALLGGLALSGRFCGAAEAQPGQLMSRQRRALHALSAPEGQAFVGAPYLARFLSGQPRSSGLDAVVEDLSALRSDSTPETDPAGFGHPSAEPSDIRSRGTARRALHGDADFIDEEDDVEEHNLLQPNAVAVNPLFADLPTISDGMWIAKRDNVIQFSNVATQRAQSVVKLLRAVDRDHAWIADFDPVMVCSRDHFEECQKAMPKGTIPGKASLTFGYDLRTAWKTSAHTYIPVPDSVFQDWTEAGIEDFERAAADLRRAGRELPVKNIAGWVGSSKTHPTHARLLSIAQENPNLLESNEMDWRPSESVQKPQLSHVDGFMSLTNLTARYAYLIDLKSDSYSFRQKLLMHSGRPILRQDHPWSEYYDPMLQPFVHYVPVAEDLHDLSDKIRWLQDNPQIGHAIGAHAQRFARRHLTRAAAELVWANALQRIAHMPAA